MHTQGNVQNPHIFSTIKSSDGERCFSICSGEWCRSGRITGRSLFVPKVFTLLNEQNRNDLGDEIHIKSMNEPKEKIFVQYKEKVSGQSLFKELGRCHRDK